MHYLGKGVFLHFPSALLYNGDDNITCHMLGLKEGGQELVNQCQQNLGYGRIQHVYYYCYCQLCVLQFDFKEIYFFFHVYEPFGCMCGRALCMCLVSGDAGRSHYPLDHSYGWL